MRFSTFMASLGALTLLLTLPTLSQAQLPTIFSTGVDGSGTQLALGSNDPHYTSLTTGNPALVTNIPGRANPQLYTLQSPTSRWVWDFADASGTLPGVHNFTTTFSLTALDVSGGLTLTGRFAADNAALVYLNNALIGATSNGPNGNQGFVAFANFSTSSSFVTGANTLRFEVTDFGGFAGLNVDQVSLSPGAAAPEPGSLVLLSLGVVGGIVMRRRRGH
jgi:hypothetical protein